MSLLTWSEELQVQHPRMDATHREFVELIGQVESAALAADSTDAAASAAALPALQARYDELLAHTVEHFAQEDRWMAATGFSADNCHSSQHSQVLAVLREVRRLAFEDQQPVLIGKLLPELVQWFEGHAQAADYGLAQHLKEIGFDTETGICQSSNDAATGAISGCGAPSCSH